MTADDLAREAPARLPTARSGPFYGMVLFVCVLSVVSGTLLISYTYLAANSDDWGDGRSAPSGALLGLAIALSLVSVGAVTVVGRSVDHDSPPRSAIPGLLVCAATSASASAAMWLALVGMPRDGPADAFRAATMTLSGYAAALLLLSAAASVLVAWWLWRGHEGNVSVVESVRIVGVLVWFVAALTLVVVVTVAIGGGAW